MHLAGLRQETLEDAPISAGLWLREYFDILLWHPVPKDVPDDQLIEKMTSEGGAWVVSRPHVTRSCTATNCGHATSCHATRAR